MSLNNPLPERVETLWDSWSIEMMVLLSLTLQIILSIVGSRRKYASGCLIRFVVWSAYLMGTSVTTVALGKLMGVITLREYTNEINNGEAGYLLNALWASLLLLHLGGPDTITAYSSEDVQLWIRRLLELVVRATVTIYLLIVLWTGSLVSIITLPMFTAGIIKYGETIWVLRYANHENPQGTLINDRDYSAISDQIKKIPKADFIMQSYLSFQIYKHYIADYVGCISRDNSEFMDELYAKPNELFKFIEFELEFTYDVLYTKAALIYSKVGCILHFLSFICTVTVLVVYFSSSIIYYSISVGDIITFILLAGAVVLEVYAFTQVIWSNWGIIWMLKHCKNHLMARILPTLVNRSVYKWKRWSNSVAQFNLLRFCLYEENKPTTMLSRILKRFSMDVRFLRTHVNKLEDFKKLFAEELLKIVKQFEDRRSQLGDELRISLNSLDKVLGYVAEQLKKEPLLLALPSVVDKVLDRAREHFPKEDQHQGPVEFTNWGKWALIRSECDLQDFQWRESKFDENIITWHIATDICYYQLANDGQRKSDKLINTSKLVSDYMMHLLVDHPGMLRITASNCMFESTSKLLKEICPPKGLISTPDVSQVCATLLRQETRESSVSPLMDSIKLAKLLRDKYPHKGWEIINSVWMEMLCYAANQCPVDDHVEQLRRGGQLLTLVWALISHTRLSEKGSKMQSKMNDEEHPLQLQDISINTQ